jgi:hypothetical protein
MLYDSMVVTITVKRTPRFGAWDTYMRGVRELPIVEVVERVVRLTSGVRDFWRDAQGWAPDDAAALLSRSRLDWQVSLARCLQLWASPVSPEMVEGQLILGWANLGSLVARREGSKSVPKPPDSLSFEEMRQFFRRRIWDAPWDDWVQTVQHRRNAIHAYKDRDLSR